MSYRKELQLLARHGNAAAQCDLARLYCFGGEMQQDQEAAAEWFLKAAKQGHVEAQINIAVLYAKGQGVPQDAVRALMWSIIAASHANHEAQDMSDIIAESMSDEQIFLARRLALKWTPRRSGAYHQVRPADDTPLPEDRLDYAFAG